MNRKNRTKKNKNWKRNTIFAIIITFIIISTFVIVSFNSKTEEEYTDLPLIMLSEEELEYERSIEIPPENLFNDKTKHNFEKLIAIEETAKNNDTKEKNNKLTGLASLKNNNKNLKLNDKNYWQDYFTPGHRQSYCSSCAVMGVNAALEAYFNKKYKLKQKISLSRQYLVSYVDFKGCSGNFGFYYINLLNLEGNNKDIETRNAYLKEKIKKELELSNQFIKDTNRLKTRTQYSIAAGEVPFGLPKTDQLPYVNYDSCEIVKIDPDNPDFAVTGMDLRILDEIYSKKPEYKYSWLYKRKTILTKEFCPDYKDRDIKPHINKLFIPKRNDDYNKIFVENYFKIDKSEGRKQTIKYIKEALEVSPLTVSTPFFVSIRKYKKGNVWEKETDENKDSSYHSWNIAGWGVDENSGKEYWILKNNWSDTWGENSFMRVWMNDPDLLIEDEKTPIYGFSGDMVTIQGKELNQILDQIKQEIESKKQKEIKDKRDAEIAEKKTETYQSQQNKYNTNNKIWDWQKGGKNPFYNLNQDTYKGGNLKNIGYQDTKYISDEKCTNIVSCIYDKLSVFYEDEKQEEFT